MEKNTNKAFTLIELLVVITIIGILASVILVSINNARAKARDARRASDLRDISNALNLYHTDFNQFPADAGISALAPDYITAMPNDPLDATAYGYASDGCASPNQEFVLRATLEEDIGLLVNDVDGTYCGLDCSDASNYYCAN